MIFTLAGALLTGISGYAGGQNYLGTVATNVFSNLVTDGLKYCCRFGEEAYFRRYRKIDGDFVVVRGVRGAQLAALRVVLQSFDTARRTHSDPAQDSFAGLLRDFLKREEGLAPTLRLDGLPEAVALLPDAAAAALAARRGPADAASERERFRRASEAVVLAELRASVFEDIPPFFLTVFEGDRARASGWFDLFFRKVANLIETDPAFGRIWQAEQVAAIDYVVGETAKDAAETLAAVQAIQHEVVEQGTAFAALAGEVEAVRAHVAAIHARTIGDGAMPLDFAATVDTGGHLRFAARNPLVPFFGRTAEIEALCRFLAAPPDYAWWLLCGSGGAARRGWH
jgi:hypothetical protein